MEKWTRPGENYRDYFCAAIVNSTPSLPEKLPELLAMVPDPGCRHLLIEAAIIRLGDFDPAAAMKLLAQYSDTPDCPDVQNLVYPLSQRMPLDETISLLRRIPDGELLDLAISQVWSRQDRRFPPETDRIFSLLENYPGKNLDDIYRDVISATFRSGTPATGADKIHLIQDPEIQARAYSSHLKEWMKLDPHSAWTWLDSHDVPEEVRLQFDTP